MNNKVDVQALEQRISELEDKVEKMRRDYNDLMYNLDEDNFTSEFLSRITSLNSSVTNVQQSVVNLAIRVMNLENI